MTKENAINKLISQGMSQKEAYAEFNATVNWYLRGTLHTALDRAYATECAIGDILNG